MARPRVIDPKGTTKAVSAVLPGRVYREIEREAKRRGVSIGQVVRERLGAA